MHIKIRLKASKNKQTQCCRIVAIDVRSPRDGQPLDNLGTYNKHTKTLLINRNRLGYWLSVGAIPTESIVKILGMLGEVPFNKEKEYEFNKKADRKTD